MQSTSYHEPVLLAEAVEVLISDPNGVYIDGTLGGGGHSTEILKSLSQSGKVFGIDQDDDALRTATSRINDNRFKAVKGNFGYMDMLIPREYRGNIAGILLDLGVSSHQIDEGTRGFSFREDGPLDMRMSQDGPSAADLVNGASEGELADILYHFGEERASRRIARAIVRARSEAPLETTLQLAAVVSACLPHPKPGQSHPATRSFQALRIAVNAEFSELVLGLEAAERALKPGGLLAVVSFHSLEDRIVKRFMQLRAGRAAGQGSRHAPQTRPEPARFELVSRKGIGADEAELAANPRSRSALLRIARRTEAPAGPVDRAALGLPLPVLKGGM